MADRRPIQLFAAWIFASALGEGTGMLTSSLFGASVPAALRSMSPWQSELLVAVGGMIEGSFLGAAQALVMKHIHPKIAPWKWVISTLAGMTLGWLVGTHVDDPFHLEGAVNSPVSVLTFGVVLGLVLGAFVGLTQALVLRSEQPARRWIVASSAGWGAGMVVTFFGNAPIPAGAWTSALFLQVAATGAATGLIVGAATGLTLAVERRPYLVAPRPRSD